MIDVTLHTGIRQRNDKLFRQTQLLVEFADGWQSRTAAQLG